MTKCSHIRPGAGGSGRMIYNDDVTRYVWVVLWEDASIAVDLEVGTLIPFLYHFYRKSTEKKGACTTYEECAIV